MATFKSICITALTTLMVVGAGTTAQHLNETHLSSGYAPILEATLQCAAMLAAILAGVSPAGGNYPVATVAITGDGAGDQTVESPVVKVLAGWM
jgi:hypothetical protein